MRKEDKKGASLLVENIIFIVLNLLFLTILVLFIAQQGEGLIVLEQSYAKQIALVIDSARSGMIVTLDFKKGAEKLEEGNLFANGETIKDYIKINGNIVTVKLDKNPNREGYSYSFFNQKEVKDYYLDGEAFTISF